MKEDSKENESAKPSLEDLEQLRNLSFQPQWTVAKNKKKHQATPVSERNSVSAPKKDRRPSQSKARDTKFRRTETQSVRRYQPIVSFSIYPEDEPFDILIQSIRSTLRVYELFDLTRLILDKPDRMAVVIRPLKKGDFLYLSLPGKQVFLKQEAALEHALQKAVEREYQREEMQTEPPKGNFTTVLRCPRTGKYLPPRSYHRFSSLLSEHHRQFCPEMSLDHLDRSLQATSDEEAVQEWMQGMSRKVVYRAKGTGEGEGSEDAETHEGLDNLLSHLRAKGAETWVKPVDQVRLPGTEMLNVPDEKLRESFASYYDWQKRYPLETSNFVRMKLRKNRFFLFKKGKKGISYVAGVRRQYRPAEGVFADSVTNIMKVLDEHPDLQIQSLPAKLYPEKVNEQGKVDLSVEEKKSLLQDLKWLKQEGYLYEYGDGKLELQPLDNSPAALDRQREDQQDEPGGKKPDQG